MLRFFKICRHPLRWMMGSCFICGELMLFEPPVPIIGNKRGFCYTHGTSGSL